MIKELTHMIIGAQLLGCSVFAMADGRDDYLAIKRDVADMIQAMTFKTARFDSAPSMPPICALLTRELIDTATALNTSLKQHQFKPFASYCDEYAIGIDDLRRTGCLGAQSVQHSHQQLVAMREKFNRYQPQLSHKQQSINTQGA